MVFRRRKTSLSETTSEIQDVALKTVGDKYAIARVKPGTTQYAELLTWVTAESKTGVIRNPGTFNLPSFTQATLESMQARTHTTTTSSDEGDFVYAAVDDQGFVGVRAFSYDATRKAIISRSTYVARRARNREGLGEALFTLGIDKGRELGGLSIECDTAKRNKKATSLLKKLGFDIARESDHTLHYRKKLTHP